MQGYELQPIRRTVGIIFWMALILQQLGTTATQTQADSPAVQPGCRLALRRRAHGWLLSASKTQLGNSRAGDAWPRLPFRRSPGIGTGHGQSGPRSRKRYPHGHGQCCSRQQCKAIAAAGVCAHRSEECGCVRRNLGTLSPPSLASSLPIFSNMVTMPPGL